MNCEVSEIFYVDISSIFILMVLGDFILRMKIFFCEVFCFFMCYDGIVKKLYILWEEYNFYIEDIFKRLYK